MHRFANPGRFLRLANAVLPWSAGLAAILIALGLYLAFFVAPPDYQQGESVRIMYVHVPAAWMALFVYGAIAAASASSLIWRHPLADLIAKASSPLGAGFTFVALVTGSFWGKPMWGTWWVWDARLTSMLVLFFLYLGHMALMSAFEDPVRGFRAAAVLALVGVVNLPIIKFSVECLNTLHQPASVFKVSIPCWNKLDQPEIWVNIDAPTIHASMLWPLLAMALGFTFYYVTLMLLRVKSEIIAARLRARSMAVLGAR